MDPTYEDLALQRARQPGLAPPTRHVYPPPRRGARLHLASTLRRVADRLDG